MASQHWFIVAQHSACFCWIFICSILNIRWFLFYATFSKQCDTRTPRAIGGGGGGDKHPGGPPPPPPSSWIILSCYVNIKSYLRIVSWFRRMWTSLFRNMLLLVSFRLLHQLSVMIYSKSFCHSVRGGSVVTRLQCTRQSLDRIWLIQHFAGRRLTADGRRKVPKVQKNVKRFPLRLFAIF
jgi:hypothetical protein